jgi:hypothetical protein
MSEFWKLFWVSFGLGMLFAAPLVAALMILT